MSVDMAEDSSRSLFYFRLLWQHRKLLIRVTMFALIASVGISFIIPSRYESTTRLMPPDNSPTSGLGMMVAAMAGNAGSGMEGLAGDILGVKTSSDVFVGILASRTLQDKLIDEFDLKKLYWDRKMEDARKDLESHTSISVDRKSQIITIAVTDRDPKRAAAMAQAYVVELNRLAAELSTSSARRERIFLEGRLQAVSAELEKAEREFSQFSSKNAAIDIKEQGKAMMGAAAGLQGELIATESELEGARQIYTENNIRVKAAEAKVAELKAQLQKLGGTDTSISQGTDTKEDTAPYPSLRKLPILGVTYADLYRNTRVQEAVYETLTKEYELAKVEEAKEIPTVKVLDSPDIPDKRSFPPRVLITITGAMLGLFVTASFVCGRTIWRECDDTDPRKLFIREVCSSLYVHLPTSSRNGAHVYQKDPEVLDQREMSER